MKYLILLIFVLKLSSISNAQVNKCPVESKNLQAPTTDFLLSICGSISKSVELDNRTTLFEAKIFSWIKETSGTDLEDQHFNPCVKAWIEKFYDQLIVESQILPPCDHKGHIFNAFADLNYLLFWDRMINVHKIDLEFLNTPVLHSVKTKEGVEYYPKCTPLDITEYEILGYEGLRSNGATPYITNDLLTVRNQLIKYGVKNAMDINPDGQGFYSPSAEEKELIEKISREVKAKMEKKVDDGW